MERLGSFEHLVDDERFSALTEGFKQAVIDALVSGDTRGYLNLYAETRGNSPQRYQIEALRDEVASKIKG